VTERAAVLDLHKLSVSLRVRGPALGRSTALVVALYASGIVGAEVALAVLGILPGVAAHSVLMLALLNHYVLARADSRQRLPTAAAPDALLVLALVPLLRILSVTMAIEQMPPLYRYAVIGAPLLLASALAAWTLGGVRLLARLRTWSWQREGPVALAGVPLGLLAFLLAPPAGALADASPGQLLVASAILIVFTALAEEVIFRGLLQDALAAIFGRAGILGSSLLFASVYLKAGPTAYVALIALVGLAFAWLVERTGSLLGVVIAHGLLNIGLLIVWPLAFG
jgi:membrane protease YdiL (CAAX protease family)